MSKRVRFLKDWGKSKAGATNRVADAVVDLLVKDGIAKLEDGSAEEAKKKAAADAEAAKESNAKREAEIAKKFAPEEGDSKKKAKAAKAPKTDGASDK